MDKFIIHGGAPLVGSVTIGGAKNAALPILFSTLLTDDACAFNNVPQLHDVASTRSALEAVGATCKQHGTRVQTQARKIKTHALPYDLVRKMRASILALGPLLAREGRAEISLPGGCAIGARPIDIHLAGLKKMGVRARIKEGNIHAQCRRLKGAHITLPFPSVTATENLMMAAALANGTTVIENAAREPEVCDLAVQLRGMGASIDGDGHATMTIDGVSKLHGNTHTIMPDRIEAGTYMAAVAACGGEVVLNNIGKQTAAVMGSVLRAFKAMGLKIVVGKNEMVVQMSRRARAKSVSTAPYPGFPTDMQAQLLAVNTLADGSATITETIFENRFMHALEMMRMGADIQLHHNTATITGCKQLLGAPVMATDLRASASLVICALAAHGKSTINRIYHLDRGYYQMDKKLRALGANIRRMRSR